MLSFRLILRRLTSAAGIVACWATASSTLAAQPQRPAAKEATREYAIGAGDVLQVFVWKEPELSRDVTVRTDGRISVPLLGDVEAAGKTPPQLAATLTTAFGKFLGAPQVTVGVTQPNSNRFYVLGKVGRPGEFPLTARVTVLQALAIAGGLGEYAKADSIMVIREGQSGQTFVAFNYKKIEDAKDIGQNILLRPGDTIIVP